ncbi:MAG: GGDEF domain-containing protein [Bacilli bacterium]|nr:GGDEF domain-containing protein [Bacilli bacterium]
MNKKAKLTILVTIVLVLLFGIFYFFTNEDKKTSLTVLEKQWIENNKSKVVDVAVLNDIPIVSYSGSGIFYDFFDSLEKDTGLAINKLPYNRSSKINAEYALAVKDDIKNSILLYQDNYVIVTKEKLHYNAVTELKNLRIGVLSNNLSKVTSYLGGAYNLSYKDYKNENDMLTDIKGANIDGMVVPKLEYLKYTLENDLYIAYNIDEYKINYVITLGNNKKLNRILTKYYENYKKNKYQKSYNKYLMDSYFTFNSVDEKEQTSFRSKRYKYGLVYNAPFEMSINGSLKGINHAFIKNFTKMTNTEIDFKRYSSIRKMVDDFNKNDLDIISNDVNIDNFKMDTLNTVSVYDNRAAVISKNNISVINNVSSLNGQTVFTIKNSKINGYLAKNNISVKTFNTVDALINSLNKDAIGIIDELNYDYYVRSTKSIKKIGSLDFELDNGFILRDISENEVFNNFFDFYLSFVDTNNIVNESYNDILDSNNHIALLQTILSGLVIILIGFTMFLAVKIFKSRKTYDFKLSKADKLRYIDSMTSLKNRDYLNDNISKWDTSAVYPQAVIIVDLNNVAYINDNFGHREGDKVIIEGASILINNQLSDSELVRTDGNEFLVFTVGHDEKTIVTYIRKLNKEFKELSHGFGAAIGYSMIHDEIKTIDDAINEATIDMRNNKEEVNN